MSQMLVRLQGRIQGSAGQAFNRTPIEKPYTCTQNLLLPPVCSVTVNLQLAPKWRILIPFSFKSVTYKFAVANVKVSEGTEIIIAGLTAKD